MVTMSIGARPKGFGLAAPRNAAAAGRPGDGLPGVGGAAGGPICVGIASRGRPDVLRAVVDNLRRQTLPPASIILCCVGPEDVGSLADEPGIIAIFERAGLARQRNAILRALPDDTETVVFFDDDFLAHPNWLRAAARVFRADPTLAGITGHVLADGIKGPGLSLDEAMRHLASPDAAGADWIVEGYSPYGCNMAFRRSAIGRLRFDERLVLYGWLEDRDFGATIARRQGRLIKLGAATGVHLGVKSGRVSGRRLGYSQVMNPAYMRRKRTMTMAETIRQVARNFAANLVGSVKPEPYIDRRGRLCGNLIALADLIRVRLTPERAETL